VAQDPDPADIVTHLAILPGNTPYADKCCGVTITDSGMSPYIEPGDVVIIRADDEPASEDIVVVYTPELGTMCRKLVRKGNDIILQPFSMHRNATVFRQEELDLLPVIFKGKVIAIVRNVKSSSDSVPEL
jgi:SOS-response transcriptional repressor LexA